MNTLELESIKNEILQIKHLPPLSTTACQLLEAVSDPGIEIEALADIISQDPGLSARILGLANAAYFAQANPVNTVKEAIVRVLGLNMVKSLALSIAMCGAFETSKCKNFQLSQYWTSALGCAALSRQIATKMPASERPDPDSVYLSGLMRNLGALVLAYTHPQDYNQVFDALSEEPTADKRALEREYVGLTTPQAGEWLADRWHLPDPVIRVIAQHDNANYIGEFADQALIVGTAARWIKQYETDQATALSDEQTLCDKLNIDADSLKEVEISFREKWDEICSLAAGLS